MTKNSIFILVALVCASVTGLASAPREGEILTGDDARMTLKIWHLFSQHFSNAQKPRVIAKIRPKHQDFYTDGKMNGVFAFYDKEEGNQHRIYFRETIVKYGILWDKNIDPYDLNSIIHEMTHYYQNHYGNGLPKGGSPRHIAQKMLELYGDKLRNFSDNFNWENAFNETVAQMAETNPPAWDAFRKGCIAEGVACMMGAKVSGTFYVENTWFEVAQITANEYIYVFIPVFLAYARSYSGNAAAQSSWSHVLTAYQNLLISKQARPDSNNPWVFLGGIQNKHHRALIKALSNITKSEILSFVEKGN